ncbi:di-trans,poly-cis-decaprenylcistransferase [Ligilactobacillus hayakitensis DSM 18933 = JCM 14209]|uniref:Isoprenyl transferase n=1 Tax=Ligilactobacillus hayakitensis DSM 18933 = JCM 14209 TaxID=1423755 RepID=A0A0R1WUM5_9LACO|nr:isoprenyl transferase [Ligilactobacillus hayakitensis]KRM18806.1 di-trans,poly-cis-decaprenylcistransferase [Ligilactobacillus hayakitensis DSM 18933 = JCM 14209]
MFKFFIKNSEAGQREINLDENKIPKHIAIIMDGNGRWAQKRHLPRVAGHKQGMENVKQITKAASKMGVKVLTLYAFSTENWKRPEKEVSFLMDLPIKFFDKFVPELIENNIRINVMGYIDQLPEKTREAVNDAVSQTANCTGMVLNFALNYGGRAEIVTAVSKIAESVKNGIIDVEDINEKIINEAMMTQTLTPYNDPELVIRTSGEERISNFLLWQIAYSELVFTDTLWPDYSEENLVNDIFAFQSRNRRFGGLKEEEE